MSVARPTKHGNPYRVICIYNYGPDRQAWGVLENFRLGDTGYYLQGFDTTFACAADARAEAVREYEAAVRAGLLAPDLDSLRGANLACWCPLDQPCHADVLLELANA